MNWDDLFGSKKDTHHKVFISYYHKDDQYYTNRFEGLFGHLFISKSVEPNDIDTDVSTEYIKRLVQLNYITDTSVLVVLVGPKTYGRKHVDWEISAGLSKKVGGYSGLMGILLPEFPLTNEERYYFGDLPARLADNAKSKYADIYIWNWICESECRVRDAIENAFHARVNKNDKIDNSRDQLGRNLCE